MIVSAPTPKCTPRIKPLQNMNAVPKIKQEKQEKLEVLVSAHTREYAKYKSTAAVVAPPSMSSFRNMDVEQVCSDNAPHIKQEPLW